MVLQRTTTVSVWGWADPKEEITITTSWLEDDIVLKADKHGEWRTALETTDSKESQTINLKSKQSDISLTNILFGEVWLCSGQSNMYQPVKGYNGQPSFGCQQALVNCQNSNLRLFTVDKRASKTPLNDLESFTPWQEPTPETVADFSAVAYYYGQQLQQVLDVPVGIIHSSWGASTVRAWMSLEKLSELETVDLSEVDVTKNPNRKPVLLYNAMIAPILSYSIKGALWYQGEGNRKEPRMYEKLLPAMVDDWKTRFGNEQFPFYYVQIAPFTYYNNEVVNFPDNTAYMRESMEKCLDLIPHSGMAVTLDVGDDYCIHPPKKKEVADRLLYASLSQTYGMTSFDGQSPRYKSMEVKGSEAVLSFDHAENGLFAYDVINDVEMAGEDSVFYSAKAKIHKNRKQLVVTCDSVAEPVAVRYGWRNFVEGTLYDASLLPVSSFRTDDWDEAISK